jgi:hypothetical protein
MMRRYRWLLLVVILWLALGLRLYRLEGQSLWYDEGITVALAGRDLATITRSAAADIHPPFYYYVLHTWMAFVGNSPTAVRSLSALIGTALVALTYALGRRLFGSLVGLSAAFLAAISPFQVYYSQETRMYILVTALAALSVYAFLRLNLQSPISNLRWRLEIGDWRFFTWPLLFITATTAALYTHYFAFTVWLAVNLAVLWGVVARRLERRAVLRWGAMQVAVAALYLPWLMVMWRQFQTWPAISEPLRLSFLLSDGLRVFSLGLSVEPRLTPAVWLFGVLLGMGMLPILDLGGMRRGVDSRTKSVVTTSVAQGEATTEVVTTRPSSESQSAVTTSVTQGEATTEVVTTRPSSESQSVVTTSVVQGETTTEVTTTRSKPDLPSLLIAALYLTVPFVVMYVLSLRRPLYNPKFLLVATPAFHLLVARGISNTQYLLPNLQSRMSGAWHRVSDIGSWALGIALLTLLTIPSLRNYYFDPAYARDDYRGIARTIQAMAEPDDAVILNAPGQIEIFEYYYRGALPRYSLPRQRPPDPEDTRAALQRIVAQHERIFGIFWATDESDPQRIVETWLDEHAYKAMDAWYGNVRLVLYRVPQPDGEGRTQAIGARLGETIELLSATRPDTVTSGDVLPVTLRWRATRPVEARYKVFVQLLSATNQLMAQRDAEPGGGARLTTTWEPGEVIVDRYGVLIPPGTPPGTYRLITGMYGYATGQRLPVMRDGQPAGDFVDLGMIRVEAPVVPPPVEALGLSRRLDEEYGPLRLLGYALDKRGAEGQPNAPLYPGDVLRITLFWQAQATPRQDVELTFALITKGKPQIQIKTTPTEGLYPITRWLPGQVIRDPHDLPLPVELPPGNYRVRLAVARAGGPSLGRQIEIPITLQQGRN